MRSILGYLRSVIYCDWRYCKDKLNRSFPQDSINSGIFGLVFSSLIFDCFRVIGKLKIVDDKSVSRRIEMV